MQFSNLFECRMLILHHANSYHMKKWFIACLAIVVIAICSIYILIPSTITVSNVRYVKAYHNTVLKFLTNESKMNEWLQTIATKNEKGFTYKNYNYQISRALSNLVEININSDNIATKSNIVSLSVYLDSSAIQWSTELIAGNNPVKRLSTYYAAKNLKENMSGLMNEMKKYLDNSFNMYGITVKEIHLKDSVLITTKIATATYPSINDIYKQVEFLKGFAAIQQASATDAPMLYVKQIDATKFEAMIGLPINKIIAETSDIKIKRMPFGGNMFVTDIIGGNYSIKKGLEQLNVFLTDSKRVSPAIPFELMVTDRSKESDTTKWITRLYFPIM